MHQSRNKILFLLLGIVLFNPFCRKIDNNKTEQQWSIAEAKEWWYGTFKKQPAYKETDVVSPYVISFNQASGKYEADAAMKLNLKKYPVWKMGTLFRTGKFGIAEFPLLYPARIAPMPQAALLNEQQKKKIAECMLNRVLMIRTPSGATEVRLATIIPEYTYAMSRNFDISNNSMHELDKKFKGWIIIREWNEAIINIYEIEAGKIARTLTMRAAQPGKNANTLGSTARTECGYAMVEVWHKVCIEGPCEPPQDIPCINNCADWYYTMELDWQWVCVEMESTDCDQNGLPYEQCMCYYYGLNCYDYGDGEDNTMANTPCAIADSLNNDRGLIIFQSILRQAVSGNKERMYILNHEEDEYKYVLDTSGIADSLGAPDFQIPSGFQCDGIMHNHFDVLRSLNTFSASDLLTLGSFLVNDAIRDVKTFIFTLAAKDGSNYDLVITNKNKFRNFIENDVQTNNIFPLEAFYMKYNINSSNSKQVNEKNFLTFLKNEDIGLTLLKTDNGSWNWTPLKLQNNGTVTTAPCS